MRNGVATLFVEVEPLRGRRHFAVTERRTRQDWARFIKTVLDERSPNALKVRRVMDNLNTHEIASLYETFLPPEARSLAERLEIHYAPKHGSWLNIAEIELSALNGQCLCRRIPSAQLMRSEIAAWQSTATIALHRSTGTSLTRTHGSNSPASIRNFRRYGIIVLAMK